MALPLIAQSNKVRVPWALRGKLEISPLQLVGQNALGLPYLQGTIRNRSNRALNLRVVARVFNDMNQPIFTGTPGILDTFELEPQQQRTFRISLRDVTAIGQRDRARLWATRHAMELVVEG